MKLFKSKWGAWKDITVTCIDYKFYLLQVSVHDDGRKKFRRTFVSEHFSMTTDVATKILSA